MEEETYEITVTEEEYNILLRCVNQWRVETEDPDREAEQTLRSLLDQGLRAQKGRRHEER
jgi:hypothetical protein